MEHTETENYLVKEIIETYTSKGKHYFEMELEVFDSKGWSKIIVLEFNSYEFLRELDTNEIIPTLKKNLKEGIDQL
ncbi:MAG: hypothetical protein ABF244_06510 [Flavobacteriaceae bacterium]